MSEREREAYGAADDFEAFDAVDDEGREVPGLVILLFGVFVLITFVAVAYIAYQQGVHHGSERAVALNVPEIPAEPGPLKLPRNGPANGPAEPDREVFDRLGDQPQARPEELVAPQQEEPILRDSVPAEDVTAGDVIVEDAPRPAVPQPLRPEILNQPEPQSAPAPVTPPAPPPVVVEPEPAPAPSGVSPGDYVVQVAAFRDEPSAMAVWERLKGRFPSLMAGVGPDIEVAEVAGRGTYYRLRIGPFGAKGEADEFCRTLRSRGQDCLVKRV